MLPMMNWYDVYCSCHNYRLQRVPAKLILWYLFFHQVVWRHEVTWYSHIPLKENEKSIC